MKLKLHSWMIFALFLLAGVIVFWQPVFHGYFLGDDWWLINDHDWSRLLNYFSGNWTNGSQGTGGFYRPLVRTTLLFDSSLYGTHPLGYHVFNLLLHVVNAFLISRLASMLLGRNIFGLIAGLLFLVYPQSHEAVAWISARTALLATCFILLSTYLFLLHTRTERRLHYVLALLAYLFGLLSQESVLLTPLLLLAYHLSQGKANFGWAAVRRLALQIVPFVVIGAIYVLVRSVSLGSWIGGYGTEVANLSPAGAYETLYNYILRLSTPTVDSIDPQYAKNLIPDLATGVTLGAIIALLILTPRIAATRCFVLWLVISVLPFLSYPHLARFYYLPAAMFCLLLGSLFAWLAPKPATAWSWRGAFIAVSTAVLVIYYSVLLVHFNAIWTVASAHVRTFAANAERVIGNPTSPRYYFLFQNSMELIKDNPLTHYKGAAMLHYDFPAIALQKLYKDRNPNVHAEWGIPPGFTDFSRAEMLKVRTDFSLERYRIAGEEIYSWDLSVPAQQWRARNDLTRLRSPFAYPRYIITADFPYLQSPPIGYAAPLFATLELDLRIEGMKRTKVATWILLTHDAEKKPRRYGFNMTFDAASERFKHYVVQLGGYPNLDALFFNPHFGRFVIFEIRVVHLYLYRIERI
jgi:hypothetical protein